MGSGDHDCEWRERAESLAVQLDAAQKTIAAQAQTIQAQSESLAKLSEQFASVKSTVEKLQRHVFGKRSEKITPLATAIRDPARAEDERIAALQTRRQNAEKKRQLVTRKIEHKVREDQKVCPKCGGHGFSKLGDGAMSELYELVPAIVERQPHPGEAALQVR